jgi:FOG: Ankyrin repeat
MIAAEKGSIELVQLLLDSNADVKMKDKTGRTALFHAIEANNENSDVVSLLLDNGADVNHEINDRITPLLRAVEKGYQGIARILLHKGANVHSSVESSGSNMPSF